MRCAAIVSCTGMPASSALPSSWTSGAEPNGDALRGCRPEPASSDPWMSTARARSSGLILGRAPVVGARSQEEVGFTRPARVTGGARRRRGGPRLHAGSLRCCDLAVRCSRGPGGRVQQRARRYPGRRTARRPGVARTVLEAAGWSDVETSVDKRTCTCRRIRGQQQKLTTAAGPVQVVVEGQSDSVRAEAEEALVADDPRHRVGGELHTLPAHLACRHR